jgi:hypothetical protein
MLGQAEGNGLTLEVLAQRLEALERKNERLEHENAKLQHEVAVLRGSDTGRTEKPVLAPVSEGGSEERVTRRRLLRNAGAAAVGVVAAGALTQQDIREARADNFANVYSSSHVTAQTFVVGHQGVKGYITNASAGAVAGENFGSGPGVEGKNNGTGPAIEGTANGSDGTGVKGTGRYGVWGESDQAGFWGVTGRNTNANGHGVHGEGTIGVFGKSSSTGFGAVYGQHTGSAGYGVVGDGKGTGTAGVLGRHSTDAALQGEGRIGVYGKATTSTGYGGVLQGGKAQLRLVPGTTAGKPTTNAHIQGEFYMDSRAELWVCTRDGTPGAWRKVTTTVS